MKTLIVFIAGIVIGNVGIGGVVRMLDKGVDTVKEKSVEMSR